MKLFHKHKINIARQHYLKTFTENIKLLAYLEYNTSLYNNVLNHSMQIYNKYREYELELANINNIKCYGRIKLRQEKYERH